MLEEMLPRVLEDAFQLSVDVMCPPPRAKTKTSATAVAELAARRASNGFQTLFQENGGPEDDEGGLGPAALLHSGETHTWEPESWSEPFGGIDPDDI